MYINIQEYQIDVNILQTNDLTEIIFLVINSKNVVKTKATKNQKSIDIDIFTIVFKFKNILINILK